MTETSITVEWWDGIIGAWMPFRDARDEDDIAAAITELTENARPYDAPRIRVVTTTIVEIDQ